jgi:hypothetical protein
VAVTRTDFYTVAKRLVSALNGGTAGEFTLVLADPRRSLGEIFSAIQAADDDVCRAIAETEGHGLRSLFMADSADLEHGDTLPDHLGPTAQLRIQRVTGGDFLAARFDKDLTLADIENWRANPGQMYGPDHDAAGSLVSGYGLVLGGEAFFTGHKARAKLANYERASRTVTDASMSAASKNLSSATAAFTADDVGGAALIDGAGAGGAPLLSRIDSRTGATLVSLRDAASTAVSGKTLTVAKLQSPQSLEDAVLCRAMTHLPKRGDNLPFHSVFVQEGINYLNMIKGGAITVPPLEVAQAA